MATLNTIASTDRIVSVEGLKEFKKKYTEKYVGDLKKKVADSAGKNPGDAGYVNTEGLATVKEYVDSAVSTGGTGSVVSIKEISTGLAAGVLKSYEFYQGDNTVAANKIGTINLAKDLVVTAGEVVTVAANTVIKTPETTPGAGDQTYYAAGTYLKLTIANQTAPVYIDVKDLADVYTAKKAADVATDKDEVQVAISTANVVSATLVNGTVAKTKLTKALSDEITAATTNIGVQSKPESTPGAGDAVTATGIYARLEGLEGILVATNAEIDAIFA